MLTPILPRSILATVLALACGANTYADTNPDAIDLYGSQDSKGYPATFCDSNKPGSIKFTQNGKVENPSTSTSYEVTCPVIHDQLFGVDFNGQRVITKFLEVGIGIINNSKIEFPCYVRGRSTSGESGYVRSHMETPGGIPNESILAFTNVPSWGYNTTIGCKLPPATGTAASTRTAITGYYTYESSEAYYYDF